MSQDNVARLPTREPASEVPALGMSIQVDLGLGRIATLQTFVPSNASQVEINWMLDKMTRAGDRQRAQYRLEELHRDLLEEQRKHVQMQADQQANIVAGTASPTPPPRGRRSAAMTTDRSSGMSTPSLKITEATKTSSWPRTNSFMAVLRCWSPCVP